MIWLRQMGRIAYALLMSGTLAGWVFAFQLGVGMLFIAAANPPAVASANFWFFAGLFLSIPAFICGIAILGVPAWLAARSGRLNSPVSAMLLGGAAASGVGLPLLLATLDGAGTFFAMPLPLAGAIGGWVFRELAEGPKPRPAPPS